MKEGGKKKKNNLHLHENFRFHLLLLQPARDGVRDGRLDARLRHQRRGVDLPDSRQAGVGADADDQRVLCPIAALFDDG